MRAFIKILLLVFSIAIATNSFSQGAGLPPGTIPKNKFDIFNLRQARKKIANEQWRFTLAENISDNYRTVMEFDKKRPVVVVLVQGITGYPNDSNKIGTLSGARNYWGYDFIDGIFGKERQQDKLLTFADGRFANVQMGRSEWETEFIESDNYRHHFITVYGIPEPARNIYTPISVMMTYRDGSKGMKQQVSETAAQIVSLYTSAFGSWPAEKKPQIILLCHSFGGIVARTICSKAINVPTINPRESIQQSFTPSDMLNMEFIRNKTLHITTFSSPHDGSPITKNADLGANILNFQAFDYFGVTDPLVEDIDAADPDAPVIRQLSVPFVANLNKTIIQPDKCVRGDGSLVPIHAMGGRTPGGPRFFSDPNQTDLNLTTIDGGIGGGGHEHLYRNQSNREKYESVSLMRVDYAMHFFFGPGGIKPWGATPANNTGLDIIKVQDVNAFACLDNPVYNAPSFFLVPRLFYLKNNWTPRSGITPCTGVFTPNPGTPVSDGEIDNDGFVPINSALGVNLGTTITNFFDHSRSWAVSGINSPIGSWYRMYRSGADFHNHGSIKMDKAMGVWLRENIFGFTLLPFVYKLNEKSAGPNVALAGTVSSW